MCTLYVTSIKDEEREVAGKEKKREMRFIYSTIDNSLNESLFEKDILDSTSVRCR